MPPAAGEELSAEEIRFYAVKIGAERVGYGPVSLFSESILATVLLKFSPCPQFLLSISPTFLRPECWPLSEEPGK
jgi:hypothetical protein